MSDLTQMTFSFLRHLFLAILFLIGPSHAFGDVVSVQNTWYYGRIVEVTDTQVIFDLECSGQIIVFETADLDGLYPSGEIQFLDRLGKPYVEPLFECTEPRDVTEAVGGAGHGVEGGAFCPAFRQTFGRDPRNADSFFVFETYIRDDWKTQTYRFYESVRFRDGRPIGVIGGVEYFHGKLPFEESIRVWQMGSGDDDLADAAGGAGRFCEWH